MFVVTNRRIDGSEPGFDQFLSTPNENGPNELRLFEATKTGRRWRIAVFRDTLTREQKEEVGLPVSKKAFASQYVSRKLLGRIRSGKRDLVFFVHGFNNDVESVLERAHHFEQHYGVEVLAFSWPANGGGVKGVASYKSDKRDARVSAGAVYRAMQKAREYLDAFNAEMMAEIHVRAAEEHPTNMELRDQYVTRMAEKGCPFSVTLVAHSMGNYLLKQIHASSTYDGHHMLFDNVVLVAADTNNHAHAAWVDRIRCRKRIYITINEDDGALRASRVKSGSEQLARLGHYLHRLDSRDALYVDVTDAPEVGVDHAYFEGDAVENKRSNLYRFFDAALHGRRAEVHLNYHGPSHTWRP